MQNLRAIKTNSYIFAFRELSVKSSIVLSINVCHLSLTWHYIIAWKLWNDKWQTSLYCARRLLTKASLHSAHLRLMRIKFCI